MMHDLIQRLFTPQGFPTPVEEIGAYISLAVGLVFTLLYAYQFFYILVALLKKPKTYPPTDQTKRYGVLIAARNEETVLPQLLACLASQTYPADLVEVFVVADNCTDSTAAVAAAGGATVFVRQDKSRVGKGYALAFLFDRIRETVGLDAFDAYLVFDADNVLRDNYIEEMDKAYCAGNPILTSYRNSKNYSANWISAGYALWFLREARHLNNPRSLLGTGAAISGTGFLIDSDIIKENGGWRHFLLTEDIEFTVDCALHGRRIGYCHAAELFDEQPETFAASWRQRKRWAKGFFQVTRSYGKGLFKGAICLQWSCFDMALNIMPAFLLSVAELLSLAVLYVINCCLYPLGWQSGTLLRCFLAFFLSGYSLFLLVGAITLMTEWRKIHCSKPRAILLLFLFPIFMLTYIPISVVALFTPVEWAPIHHKHAKAVSDIEKDGKRVKK